MTMESVTEVESIYRTVYQGDGSEIQLVDRLPENKNVHEQTLDKIFLEELLEKLDGEERQLIGMRYFQDMTQMEVAGKWASPRCRFPEWRKKC